MRTRDGVELTGRDATELVRELHKMSRSPVRTDAEFRYQMAGRARLTYGRRVRTDCDENFIADLVEIGELTEE